MQLCSALAANYAAADLETLKDTIENAKVRVKLKASLSEKCRCWSLGVGRTNCECPVKLAVHDLYM